MLAELEMRILGDSEEKKISVNEYVEIRKGIKGFKELERVNE